LLTWQAKTLPATEYHTAGFLGSWRDRHTGEIVKSPCTTQQNQQLRRQYQATQRQAEGALAGTDQLDGSTGAYDMGQLARTNGTPATR
jgi:hypothetical protein